MAIITNNKESIQFELEAEGIASLNNISRLFQREIITPTKVAEIRDMNYEELKEYLSTLSSAGRWIARRLWEDSSSHDLATADRLKKAVSDLAAFREIKKSLERWNSEHDFPHADQSKNPIVAWSYRLLNLGVRFGDQAIAFMDLYTEVYNPHRPWGSCYQADHNNVLAMAKAPQYRGLPTWVKKVLANSPMFYPSHAGRSGDPARLIAVAKAWKYAPDLPKAIAERIGEMPLWKRIIADQAWEEKPESQTRQDKTLAFWYQFNELVQGGGILNTIRWLLTKRQGCNSSYRNKLTDTLLGLPRGFTEHFLREEDMGLCEAALRLVFISEHRDEYLKFALGTSAKTVKDACQHASIAQIQWAIALAPKGNPDIICKFLTANCLPYEKDAVEFLYSLGWQPALRMLTTHTYKSRGEVKPLPDYMVRDTAMLYHNIISRGEEPRLGRVRCWLTVHEELGRQYVQLLPDEAVYVNPLAEQIDGVTAIDQSWRLAVPRSTATLKQWGAALSNCVGGYGNVINRRMSVVIGVEVDRLITYAIEVREGEVKQFYGFKNSKTPPHIVADIKKVLLAVGLINS